MNATQIIEMIEYHNNDALMEASSNLDFNPNGSVKNNSFITKAVEYNNLTAFTMLINHPNLIVDEIRDNDFCDRIIQRINMSENKINREFFNQLLMSKYELHASDLCVYELKPNIFKEIFNKMNKTDFYCLLDALKQINNLENFKVLFFFMKDNFPEIYMQSNISGSILSNAVEHEKIEIIDFIRNEGFDIKFSY